MEKLKQKKIKKPKDKKSYLNLLLFKNAAKQAFRNKIQLIGLAVLVLLSSTIFSLMQTSLTRVDTQYKNLISEEQSNIHDFIFDPYNTAKLTNDLPEPNHPEHPDDPAAAIENQQLYLNEIANNPNNSFIWDRVEARTLQLNNHNDPKVLKLIAYNKDARIDKLIINHGFNIGENPNEIVPIEKQTVINKEFANKNNLIIGDVIRVQLDEKGDSLKVDYDITNPAYNNYNWLKIVGFGGSADFITPIIDQTTPLPNKTKEGILYVEPTKFGFASRLKVDNNWLWFHNKSKDWIGTASSKDTEVYYVGKSTMTEKNDLTEISNFFKARYVDISNAGANLVYRLGDSNYRFNSRTSTLPGTIQAFKSLLIALLLIVLVITGITVILITFKNIDNSKPQIGILKSLGYSNWKILITSLAYPMFAALIGTILVFFPASGLQILVVNTFANYFNLNFGSFVFDGLGYLYCLLLTFGFLSIIAWIISALTVVKNPIVLIKNISNNRDSLFKKFIKKISGNATFLTRFRLALFTSSIGKMLAVFLTMFLGTVLMTTAIIGPKIMTDNQRNTYTGMNYQTLTEYVNPTYNSPFSFYKTYNPNSTPWDYEITKHGDDYVYKHPKRTNEQFAQELIDNNINPEAYAPITPDPTDQSSLLTLGLNHLTYLYGKMFTKNFLDGLDASTTDPTFLMFILPMAWPEGLPIHNLAQASDIYSLEQYQTARTFYINYRSTIAMDLNPNVSADNNKKQLDKNKFTTFVSAAGAWNSDEANFKTDLANFEFDASDNSYPWHIANESELFDHPNPIDDQMQNQWIRKMLIWYYAIFYNRVGQAIAQGTYTKSPYFIKQNIAKAFENPDGKFNISFNVVPFDKNTDELGTYFVGTSEQQFNNKPYSIKIYGLQNEKNLQKSSLMQLYNSNGHSLNDTLERKNDRGEINIVINQTVAKQLNLKENQTFKMSANGNVLKTNQDPELPNQYTPIDLNKIDFSGINNDDPVPDGENNVTLKTFTTKYSQIPKTNTSGAYPNGGSNATPMLKEINQGNVVVEPENEWTEFKVAGIYNGYGQPTAYIAKDNADQLLHFDQTKMVLYKLYQKEWQTKGIVNGIDFSFLADNDYEEFKKLPESDPLKVIFNNEFPIFNFKFSSSNKLVDITESFSVSQAYGDYSAVGMNGGQDTTDKKIYPVYGEGTAVNVLPLYVHQQLLEQITQLVNTVLLFFIVFSLIISFFIILLTSNLVIYENRKIIATMKTLGYSNGKITNIVIGMYLPIIIATWIIGTPIGWVIVNAITNYLAFNTTWVLPLLFAWWLPLVVGVIVLGIYATTFIIEWQAMKKIRPLQILNETN
ncbi:MAG: ABC transporter permease [Spiroplasma sp.]|nr:ABC transporter permease [Spiroplasma sp.]